MSHDQTTITYNSLQPNKDFRAPLAWANKMIPRFNCRPLPSLKTRRIKKLTDFFQNTQLFTQCVSMLYTEKSVLRYYVRFSQIRSHIFIMNRVLNNFVIKLILYFIICELLGIPEICCQVLLRMCLYTASLKQHIMHRTSFLIVF